ncbi:MAG: hypothetical protein ABIH18_07985 [Candidatus Omnitrophota bacterium]
MIRKLLMVLSLCFMSSVCFAQITNDAIPMIGVIIDVQSADNNQDNLQDFIKTYTKDDALMPDALTSGYAIFLQDGYMKFDSDSNAKIVEFLDKPESTLEVTIMAAIGEDNILSLSSIENK